MYRWRPFKLGCPAGSTGRHFLHPLRGSCWLRLPASRSAAGAAMAGPKGSRLWPCYYPVEFIRRRVAERFSRVGLTGSSSDCRTVQTCGERTVGLQQLTLGHLFRAHFTETFFGHNFPNAFPIQRLVQIAEVCGRAAAYCLVASSRRSGTFFGHIYRRHLRVSLAVKL